MRLDICIPAYNEASIIEASVRAVKEALDTIPNLESHIVVADNGSTDGTGDKVKELSFPNVTVLTVPTRGKGGAVVAAARATTADLFGFIDADLSADPSCIKLLVQAIQNGAHIAVGSRLHRDARIERSDARTLSSEVFNWLRKRIVGVSVSDSQCGLKVTGPSGLTHLRACTETGWFFEIEWLARAERAGLSIKEVPITWTEFHFPGRKSKLRVIRDGFAALSAFWRIRRMLEK